MKKNYNIGAFGDGVMDIISINKERYNYTSGGTAFNVLKNLTTYNYNCFAYGRVGNDVFGEIILKRLNQLKINIDNLLIKRAKTNLIFVNISYDNSKLETKETTTCPLCLKKHGFDSKEIRTDYQLNELDCAIFDNISKNRIKVANQLKDNKKIVVFDLGYIGKLKFLTSLELKSSLYLPYTFVQINGKVVKFIMNKLSLTTLEELYKIIGSKYLITTNESEGTYITYQDYETIKNKHINFKISNVKDTCGAGDAFLAGTIAAYLKNIENEIKFFNDLKQYTKEKVEAVITTFGGTGYLQKEIINNLFDDDRCLSCGDLKKEKTKKELNLLNKEIKDLEIKIKEVNADFKKDYKKVIDSLEGETLVVGTGASYITASFITKYLKRNYKQAQFIYPRDILNYDLDKIKNLILCSYSGKTNDIKQALELAKKKNLKTIIITNNQMKDSDYNHILSYHSKFPKNRGFISILGILIPCYYLINDEKLLNFDWFKNIDYQFSNLKRGMLIDVFYDYEVLINAKDIESKMIESGLGRVSCHEKKDFSHGRFITYRDYPSDLTIILNYEKTTYQKKLLKYLQNYNKNIIIFDKLSSDELENNFLNLIKFMYLFKNMGEHLNLDLSSPGYTDADIFLYKNTAKFL